jgi:hypothetical protein
MLHSTSIRSITERHSLFPSSHARNPIGSPCGSLFPSFDLDLMKVWVWPKEDYGLTTFRVSAGVG